MKKKKKQIVFLHLKDQNSLSLFFLFSLLLLYLKFCFILFEDFNTFTHVNKKKAKEKLPTWFLLENIIYPEKISIEQTSSETNLSSVNAVLAVQNTSSTANTYSLMAFQNNGIGYARMGSKYIDASNGDFTIQVKGGGSFADAFYIKSNTNIQFPATNTAAGTTGNQTINKTSGTVNIAAAGTSITVTNSLVTTSSIVFAVIRTNDTTAVIKNVVPAAGSFTINLNAAATAETSIGFFVIN